MDAFTKIVGTARGCGWQKIGAVINLGAYYLLGIPCSVILAFVYNFGGKVTPYPRLSVTE